MDLSFDIVLISMVVGMCILAVARITLSNEHRISKILADILSLAAGSIAGILMYWWLQ